VFVNGTKSRRRSVFDRIPVPVKKELTKLLGRVFGTENEEVNRGSGTEEIYGCRGSFPTI
jgi:hypothetical protein